MALLKVKYCSTNRRNFIENRMLRCNEDVTTVTSMSVSEAQLTESTLSDLIVLMVRLGPGEDGNVA